MNDAGVVHGHGQLPVVVLVLERHPLAAAAVEHPLVLLQVVDRDTGPKVASLQCNNFETSKKWDSSNFPITSPYNIPTTHPIG